MRDHAPSVERNRDQILAILATVLPRRGTILEIASGTGQHAVHFAPQFPNAVWQPTDRSEKALASIRAWAAEALLSNLREPLKLDVRDPIWPIESAAAMVAINMLHISEWDSCRGLLTGAARVLEPGGSLVYYGAFFRRDRPTAPSNVEFDRSLRERDPAWGVRQLEDVEALAVSVGLELDQVVDMPNSNFTVVFKSARS